MSELHANYRVSVPPDGAADTRFCLLLIHVVSYCQTASRLEELFPLSLVLWAPYKISLILQTPHPKIISTRGTLNAQLAVIFQLRMVIYKKHINSGTFFGVSAKIHQKENFTSSSDIKNKIGQPLQKKG